MSTTRASASICAKPYTFSGDRVDFGNRARLVPSNTRSLEKRQQSDAMTGAGRCQHRRFRHQVLPGAIGICSASSTLTGSQTRITAHGRGASKGALDALRIGHVHLRRMREPDGDTARAACAFEFAGGSSFRPETIRSGAAPSAPRAPRRIAGRGVVCSNPLGAAPPASGAEQRMRR
jgi:hypothetical protein